MNWIINIISNIVWFLVITILVIIGTILATILLHFIKWAIWLFLLNVLSRQSINKILHEDIKRLNGILPQKGNDASKQSIGVNSIQCIQYFIQDYKKFWFGHCCKDTNSRVSSPSEDKHDDSNNKGSLAFTPNLLEDESHSFTKDFHPTNLTPKNHQVNHDGKKNHTKESA